ncbi:hypothetical protein AA0472_0914 [Acetobacter estunensis NRIC 0472]|nr:hypothetical protein AA0472_0914 [Acetobacter estunensis NRIC 0472]
MRLRFRSRSLLRLVQITNSGISIGFCLMSLIQISIDPLATILKNRTNPRQCPSAQGEIEKEEYPSSPDDLPRKERVSEVELGHARRVRAGRRRHEKRQTRDTHHKGVTNQ